MNNFILFLVVMWVIFMSVAVKQHIDEKSCNCTITWGNQTMSVEDALERMGEGLTIDQAEEIKVLINQSCGEAFK